MTTYLEDFVNFTAETTISSGINDSTTTIPVVTVTEIAAAVSGGNSPIRIRIDNELMLVTSSSSNDLTVVRGIEGTTAAAHSNGATVYPVLTKAGLVKRVEEGSVSVTTSTSTSLTLDDTHFTLLMNNSSNSTVNLPAASSMVGRAYCIKKIGNNAATVTLDPNSSETIDGASTLVLNTLYDFVVIKSDGTNWIVTVNGVFRLGTALSILGNSTNATATLADIVAASDHQVFRRNGMALAFGAINLASSNAVSGLLAWANIAGITVSEVLAYTGNGQGSTNTKIRRYSSNTTIRGTGITYADSATLGSSWTCNNAGLALMFRADSKTDGVCSIGFSLNSNQLTTGIESITYTNLIAYISTYTTGYSDCSYGFRYVAANDVIRPHDGFFVSNNTTSQSSQMRLILLHI
jgi:hypothetical protein